MPNGKVLLIALALLALLIGFIPVFIYFGLYAPVIGVQLPESYTGWVLLVPSDRANSISQKNKDGFYLPDKNGVCVVSSAVPLSKSRVKLFQGGTNIEPNTKFSGFTKAHDFDGAVYEYRQMYVANQDVWKLPDYDAYWRNRASLLNNMKAGLIDSLKREGVIKLYKN